MARSKVTALDVNASGTDTVFVGGGIGCTSIEVNNNISAVGTSIDILDNVDMNDDSLFNATGNLNINQDLLGNAPTQFGANASRAGTEQDIEVFDDCNIDGNLSKGTGTFKIDHPLDPQNKYLCHSFVESPEMRNEYYGQVNTVNGKVMINLPDWWHALNGTDKIEFNYQLTPIGIKASLWISKEIENGEFEISSDIDCKVSWRVSGIRHDKLAEENRVQVEVPKNREIIKKFPNMQMVSDLYEYDNESGYLYKKKKKDLFLLQKPVLVEMEKEKGERDALKLEKKNLRLGLNKFIIEGKTPDEIREIELKRTPEEKREFEDLKNKYEIKKKELSDKRVKLRNCSVKLGDVNKTWKNLRMMKIRENHGIKEKI